MNLQLVQVWLLHDLMREKYEVKNISWSIIGSLRYKSKYQEVNLQYESRYEEIKMR